MLSCPSGMSVSSRALNMLAEVLPHERRARRTRWRRLEAGQQALLVLAYLRQGETYAASRAGSESVWRRCSAIPVKLSMCSPRWPCTAVVSRPNHPERLGRDHQLSRATAYRYLDEVITVLADQAPDLHQALRQAHEQGMTYVILDDTVIMTDRVGEKTTGVQGKTIDLWSSRKAGEHGGYIQALSAPNGFPCGSPMSNPARHTTSLPPANMRESGCTPRLNKSRQPVSTPTTAPTTPCFAECAASANADLPYLPNVGALCSAALPAPAKPAT